MKHREQEKIKTCCHFIPLFSPFVEVSCKISEVQGPFVQIIVSLTKLLVQILLSLAVFTKSTAALFFAEKL